MAKHKTPMPKDKVEQMFQDSEAPATTDAEPWVDDQTEVEKPKTQAEKPAAPAGKKPRPEDVPGKMRKFL